MLRSFAFHEWCAKTAVAFLHEARKAVPRAGRLGTAHRIHEEKWRQGFGQTEAKGNTILGLLMYTSLEFINVQH